MNKISTAHHASEQIVSHRNLKSRFGTAFVAGCLALSLCPAVAAATAPGSDNPSVRTSDEPGDNPDNGSPSGDRPEGDASPHHPKEP